MAEPTLRPATTADILALSELACHTYRHTFGADMSAQELAAHLDENKSPTAFTQALEAGDIILVAEQNGTLIGYVGLGKATFDDRTLTGLYVHPDHQGAGIGRNLMVAALDHARKQGAAHVFLTVWSENKKAYAYYTRLGFEKVGTADVTCGGKVIGEDDVLRLRL